LFIFISNIIFLRGEGNAKATRSFFCEIIGLGQLHFAEEEKRGKQRNSWEKEAHYVKAFLMYLLSLEMLKLHR